MDAYLTRLTREIGTPGFKASLVKWHAEVMRDLARRTPFDQVIGRVAQRVAGIAVVLELAVNYGISPHSLEQVSQAIQTLFTDWVEDRGAAGSIELKDP